MPVRKSLQGSDMTEHDELVAEIPLVEKMATAERLKHAKKRRTQQLKKFSQYEKQLDKEFNKKNKNKNNANRRVKKASHNRRVNFVNNVMLLEAAARNDVSEVRDLLKRGVSADVTNEDGLTALHQCCIDDLEEMLRLLLDHGACVNAKDSELWTPLHAAATCGHIHLCKILIDNGAELLAVNADGNMAYDICEDDVTLDFIEGEMAKRGVTQEQIDTTRLSSEHHMLADLQNHTNNGGDLEFRGRVGETPLHIAAANGYVEVTEFLLNKNVSVDVEDEDSWQPIHAAACWGHLPVLELLVQHGADLEAKTRNGESPFDICEDLEMKERMMELKNEIETKGIVKNRNLVRRRSTNTRSSPRTPRSPKIPSHNAGASVRRTSMREKSAISWKEAVEEGRRFRESVSSNDDDDDDELSADDEPAINIDDVKVKFENSGKSDSKQITRLEQLKKDSPREKKESPKAEKKPAPGSRMQEAENIWAPAAGTLPHQPKSDRQPAPQQISTKKSAPAPPPTTSHDASKAQTKPQPAAQSVVPAAPQTKPQAAARSRPQTAPQSKDTKKPPPPQAIVKPTPQRPREESGSGQEKAPVKPVQNSASPASNRKQQQLELPRDNTDSARKPSDSVSLDSTPSRDRAHLAPPSGTLSDLKKQRALALQEKLQNSLRFKDTSDLQEQMQNHNDNIATESRDAKQSSNHPQTNTAQNGKVKGNNNYYMPVSENNSHKYHFTATTVVGDTDSQTSCCVVQ